jgi:hypothetical protein
VHAQKVAPAGERARRCPQYKKGGSGAEEIRIIRQRTNEIRDLTRINRNDRTVGAMPPVEYGRVREIATHVGPACRELFGCVAGEMAQTG